MLLKHLQTFVTVVEQGSVSKAALHLHIAQPALSRHIGELERELGLKLFDRIGRHLLLTGEGAQLLGNCRTLLGHVSSLSEQARQLQGRDQGVLTVGASTMQIETALATFLNRYVQRYPKVEVKLIEAVGDKTLDMLDRGEIQIALAAVQVEQIEERGFGFYAAPPLELHAVWHSKYKLDRDTPIEINRLTPHPLLLLDSGFFARKTFDAACRLTGIKPTIVIESQAPHTLLALAEAGHGVAILPSTVRIHRYEVRSSLIIYEHRPLLIPLVIIWDKRRVQPQFVKDFCELLAEYMSKAPPHRHRSPRKIGLAAKRLDRPRLRETDARIAIKETV
jgi:DNA-binding transcriptional LysR family regulator